MSVKVTNQNTPTATTDQLLIVEAFDGTPTPNGRLRQGVYYSFQNTWRNFTEKLGLDKIFVPLTRTIKINGETKSLATDVEFTVSGGVSDGNKGDITVSGSGATWTINNDAVTNDKIDSVDATKVNEDTTHRFVTDTEKSTWNGKQDALGYTPEDVANKSDSYTVSSSTTYSSTKAVVDGLATKQDKLLVSEATASNNAVIDFTLPTGYDYFELFIDHLIPQTNATSLFLRVSIDGGATFLAGATDYEVHRNTLSGSGGTVYAPSFGLAAQIAPIGALIGNTSGRFFRCSFRIFHPSDATQNKNITGEFAMLRSDGQPALGNISARVFNTSAVNAIRLLMNSGNIASGTFKLYGYKS